MKWDRRMLDMAALVASWSKDPSTQVGAVIADERHRVVSVGYNGFPCGVLDTPELLANREEKLRRTIHAEENALLFARGPVEGCTIYVTHPPCGRCAAKIIQAGITRIIVAEPSQDFAARWIDDMKATDAMLREVGLSLGVMITREGAQCRSSE